MLHSNYGKGSNIPMIKAKNKDETDIACILMMARSEGIKIPMIRSRRCQAAHMINYLRCSISVQVNYSDCSMDDLVLCNK